MFLLYPQLGLLCKAYYENIVSHQPLPITSPPTLGRGGLMADAMGLGMGGFQCRDTLYSSPFPGKTLSMISLVVATLKEKPIEHSNSTLIGMLIIPRYVWLAQRYILLVAPVSVLRTWEAQVSEHCADGLLKVFTYYDKNREIVASQLQKYDIIITSYTTVAAEFGAQPGCNRQTSASQKRKKRHNHNALFGVKWKVFACHLVYTTHLILSAVCALAHCSR
jgi:SWI/SNF-related matrix-associated actin-dependent regulator of chromatin subfamily A3